MKHIKLFENFGNKFYIVIDDISKLFTDNFKNDGVLKNLKGVSENSDILNVLGTGFECLVIMDKIACLSENNLVKVKYDDIDFLSKDNFKMFKRVKGEELYLLNDYNFFLAISYIMEDGRERFYFDLEKENIYLYNFIISKNFQNILKTEQPSIHNIDEFVNYISLFLKIDKNILYKDLSNMFIDLVFDYRYEEEWVVLDECFKIPNNSIFEIYSNIVSKENIDMIKKYFNILSYKYKIKYV